jgi:hypothetical protein
LILNFLHFIVCGINGTMTLYMMKPIKDGLEDPEEYLHQIRITFPSKKVKNRE